MKQLFTRILGIEVSYSTKVEDFIKHTGPKITYTKQPLQNEFFVRSNDLLYEQGINDFQIAVQDWEGVPCFFSTSERSNIPFDIFSASFYLLSRYEEYLPHIKDVHGRFPPKESLAFQNGFLQRPVVDIWAFKLLEKLEERFPGLKRKTKNYSYTSIIDVTTSHCYAHRGFVRSLAGLGLDLVHLKLRRIPQRIKVWFDPKKDPFNNFEYLIRIHKEKKVKSIFFFQFAAYSTHDKNVSPHSNKFRFLIKYIADYSIVSLAASYSSFRNIDLLKKEKKNLESVINRPVKFSRMRYNRVDIPETYRNLVDVEFTDDYSMGYTHELGFRAGTCRPFFFYDITMELQRPIKIHPFAVHDYALVNAHHIGVISEKLESLCNEVKNVSGNFVTIFSNELLGGNSKLNWKDVYLKTITAYNV